MFNRFSVFQQKFFWTFSEVIGLTPYDDDTSFDDFSSFLGGKLSIWKTNVATDDAISLKLLQSIFRRNYHEFIFATTTEETTDSEYLDKVDDFVIKLTNIYVMTKDRYMYLLKTYDSEKSKLLDGVKTTTEGIGRFNDTPQNEQSVADEFADKSHVSNISKSNAVAESDVDTKIARIDEITRKFRNILKDWIDEFEPLFLEGANL